MIKGLISTTTRLASALFIVSTIAACGGGGGSDSGSGFFPAPPPEGANSAPDKLTVKLTLPNGSFITETYACRVDRCADDPAQFPDFSPSPPACAQ